MRGELPEIGAMEELLATRFRAISIRPMGHNFSAPWFRHAKPRNGSMATATLGFGMGTVCSTADPMNWLPLLVPSRCSSSIACSAAT